MSRSGGGDVVVPTLAAKLLQLTAFVLVKYAEWASEWAKQLPKSLAAPQQGVTAGGHQPVVAVGGSARPRPVGDKELRMAAYLSNDCQRSAIRVVGEGGGCGMLVRHVLASLVAACAGSSVEIEVETLVRRCLTPTSKRLLEAVTESRQMMVSVIVARAAEPLIAVRAITSKYRMTNTPPPTAPSLYVRGVTQPLRAALAEGAGVGGRAAVGCLRILCQDLRSKVLLDIVTGIVGKYNDLVAEVFANVKKLGQTLKKLQKGSASAGDAGMSDDEKIYLQVYLDVEALARELKELAAGADGNEALQALREKVTCICQQHSVVLPPPLDPEAPEAAS